MDSIANVEHGSAMVQFAYLKGPLGTYAGWWKGDQGDEWGGQNEVQCQLNRTTEEFWRWNLRTGWDSRWRIKRGRRLEFILGSWVGWGIIYWDGKWGEDILKKNQCIESFAHVWALCYWECLSINFFKDMYRGEIWVRWILRFVCSSSRICKYWMDVSLVILREKA